MENGFKGLVIDEFVTALEMQGITTPTEIQKKTISEIIMGKDIIASSQTGSGKTLSYLLPVFQKINMEVKQPQAIILTPTHELATQVFKQAELLKKNSGTQVGVALIIGGANIKKQIESLKEKPRIIIGSSGRILEIIKLKKISGHYIKTIVLDEADRMVDKYNIDSVRDIIKTTLKDRQILMFSATIDDKTQEISKEIMKVPEIIKVNTSLPSEIEHIYFVAEKREKIQILRKIVHAENIKKAIVFLNNPSEIEDMVKRLNYHSIKAAALHGKEFKKDRKKALLEFKTGAITLLVASDIAARGLDIRELDYIINLDVPEEPQFYLHRAGRTGRMGAEGKCITIAEEREVKFINKYEKAFQIEILQKQLAYGEIKNFKNKVNKR